MKRCIHCPFGNSYRQCGNRNAATVQYFHGLDEPSPYFTQAIGIRDAALVKKESACFGGTHAQLVLFLARAEAGRAFLNHKCGHAVGITFFAGSDDDYGNIPGDGVRDEVFGAVEDPMIAVTHGCGVHSARIGTGARFG